MPAFSPSAAARVLCSRNLCRAGKSRRSGPSAAGSSRPRRRSGEGAGKGVGSRWRRCHPIGNEGHPMQRHRRQCRRVNDREWRCGGEVDPQPAGGTSAGMGVPGGPIAAIRIRQARVMMMIRFQQRPGTRHPAQRQVRMAGRPGRAVRRLLPRSRCRVGFDSPSAASPAGCSDARKASQVLSPIPANVPVAR